MLSSSSNEYFQPKIIKKIKQQNLKYLRQLPDWEQIEILVDNIQNNTITQQDIQSLNQQDIIALLIEDLFGYDLTYHLIVNQQFDLFINILKQTRQLQQNQLSKLLSSLFKGIIMIKKETNYKIIMNLIKQIEEIFSYYEKQIFQNVKLSIVVESHFNYKKNIWESKLLLAIIQGFINETDQQVVKLQEIIKELKFKKFLKSTTEERNQQNHLKWKKYLMNKEKIILILQAKFYDVLIDEAEPIMFELDYGHSIYMRMMKQAPFDFLTQYHNQNLEKIKLHLKSQRKCGYIVLHSLAENPNPISQEFLEILQSLDLEEEKHQNYFDQIPAVMYLEKTKQINNEFLQFLLGDIPKKDYKELEGAQLIMMIYAQQSFKEDKIASQFIKKDYLGKQRRRMFNKNQFKKRKYKGKAKYQQLQSKTAADKKLNANQIELNEIKQQTLQGYCEVNLIHQIFKKKQINFEFPISQYTLPIGHMNLYLSNIEQSLAESIQNPEILNNFLEYLLNEFCTNINENHKQIIETLISKLNLNITIPQLILQRKIMILNQLYQKNKSQNIREAIQTLLSQNSEFNYPYYGYSSYQDFQQYLYCNDLIKLNQCQNYDPSEWLMNLIRYKHYNKTHLREIASQIPQIENHPPFNQLIEFYCDQNLIHKFNYYVWFNQKNLAQTQCVNVYRRDISRQLMNSLQGVQLLFSMDKQVEDDRFMYTSRYKYYIPKLLFNFNEETIQPFYQNLLSIADEYPYFNQLKKSYQICNYQENQLKLLFQYQLIGIRLKFIPNKRIQNLKSSCIEEEIVLQQIQQNKSFIQVLLSNDKYCEFLKQSYKHYHPFWDKINQLNYFSETLHFEAYNNLRFLEEQLWKTDDLDQIREESIYKCLFEVFKKENINIYSNGFYVNKKGFKYEEKVFTHYEKIDQIKINRQIKQFFSIFQKLQSHAEKEFEYNFFKSNQMSFGPGGLYLIKILLYYLDDENIKLLEKYIIQFFEVGHPLSIVFYYKNTKNIEQTINFLSNPNMNFTSKAILKLAKIANEEKFITFLLQYVKESQYVNRNIISKILIKKYVKNYDDLRYFYEQYWNSGDIQQLYLYFLQNNEIRKVEFILLYLDINERTIGDVQIKLPHSQQHYAQALRTQWNIGLNLQQFKEIIQNNEFSLKQQENALLNIVQSGQFEKLNLILNWIQNEQQLIILTTVAIQQCVNQFKIDQLKSLYTQFNIDKAKFSIKTLSRTNSNQNNLFTNHQATAEILLKRVYEAEIDTKKYLDYIIFFQLAFPNPEFKFEDTKKRFLYHSISIVFNGKLKENWDKYLQIISQTADFYLEIGFELEYECYKKTKFFLQLIDIFYQRLGPNHQGTDIETTLKSFKVYQYKNRTDSIRPEKFSKVLTNQYFQELSRQQIKVNSQMVKIYYGQEFDQSGNSTIEELFISLMSKNRYSINSIMKRLSNLREIVEQNQVIQYLIMHGGEDTTIDVLKILGEENINESHFYYKDIPLLTYIVFKKQYKLYQFAKKHLISQWELQPKILDQEINQDIQCLTIHQFAQLNQFYVHFQIPYDIKLISRSCSFIFPNQYNKNLKAFKIYTILSQLFKSTNRRKLEIITLLLESQNDQTSESLVETLTNCSNFKIAQEILLQTIKCQNTPFAYLLENQKTEQRNLVNSLLDILNSQDQQNLEKQSQDDQLKLWKFLYNKFGLYHPVIEALVRISPNNFAESYILDSPKLALIVAQTADYKTVLNLTNFNDIETGSLRFVSEHLIKIVLMVQYEQQFDSLIKEEDFQYIHQKFYVDALNQIEINFKGSISIEFMKEMVNLLNIENPSIQLIDNLYEQVRDEPNSLKRAFKLLIKIKEYNSLMEQVKDQAINYTDNLYKKFEIFDGEKFDIIKKEDSAQLYLPFNFDTNELDQFLHQLPCHFKDLYIEAIMKKATKKKGRRKRITLNIKFEEDNLSPLYNDIRYLMYRLSEQQEPTDQLDYQNEYQIKGWQALQKMKDFENAFIYTKDASYNMDWIKRMFYQEPEQSEYFFKYQNLILVFFNQKIFFNQAQIQKLIQESLITLSKQITLKNNNLKVEIKLESYFEVFFMNEDIQNIYKDPLALIDGILNWKTLNNVLIQMMQYISQITELFELNENKQVVIVFNKTQNEGKTFKSNLIDNYVSFCNPEFQYSDKSLIINIPISNKVNFVENEEVFLNQLFDLQGLDQFIKDQYGLISCLEAKIYRYQFDKIIKQTCEEFRKQTNIQINMSLRQDELLTKIQSLDQNEQELYLQQLRIYWLNIYFSDLHRLIQSEGYRKQYHEHLLNGNLIAKPKLIGYFRTLKQKPFLNQFGFLQTTEEFAQSVKKDAFYHIFYSKCNKQQIAFCKFVELKKEKYCFKGCTRRYNQKSNFSFNLKKIRGAIQYCKEFESNNLGQLIFIGNDGQFYLNQDKEILDKITTNQSLTQFIQLSNQEFQIVFDEQKFDQRQLYFNEKNFRLQNMLEQSGIQNYEDYGIKRLKINKDLIQIDPRQISLKIANDKRQDRIPGNILTGQALVQLLTLFSCLIKPVQKIEYQILPQNDEISFERREDFIKENKMIKYVQGNVSSAGSLRNDELIFYDILNQPIKKSVESLNLKCYIQHSILEEVVYHPEIKQQNDYYIFEWAPRIKGNYNIFINGMKLNFQFSVKADEPHYKESRILKSTQEILYFNNVEFQFELFDFYGNFVSLNDGPTQKILVNTKDKKIKIKQKYEYKNTLCSIYMTFYNLEKCDHKADECQLDFLIGYDPFITELSIQLVPQQLNQQRIESFTKQFKFDGQAQFLIQRENFMISIVQLTNLKVMKKLKISFYEELAVDQGGPTREFFEMFGKELKNNQHQIMRQTLNNPNLYYFDEASSSQSYYGYLLGYLVAYAMSNQLKIGISFALPLWKVLFDIPIEFKDLEDFIEPHAYKNYLSLKDMSKEQLESLQLYFVYSIEDKELLPDGKNKLVTQETLDQFLNLTAKYLLYTKHERMIKEFKEGASIQQFKNLLIENFTLYELNQLIDTSDYQIDKDKLVKCIKFSKKGQFVQDYIFQFISEADQQILELFLQFITGSKFVNFEQKDFKIDIQCDLHFSKQRLPVSRTCNNILYVPHYDSYALFKMKITQALEWGTNFFGQN